jgi:hypothetical protein
MRLPPGTVLLYVAKWAVIAVATLVAAADNPTVVAAMLVLAVALAGLWRGSRLAWSLLVVLEVVALASVPFAGSPLWVFPLSVLALILLVVAPTRAHCDEPTRPGASGPRAGGRRAERRGGP